MRDLLAGIFRNLNNRIIATEYLWFRRLLKISILISVYLKEKFKFTENKEVLIGNYDSDLKLWINPSRTMGAAIYWSGFHEIKELMFLHRYLKSDMVFLDIGANLGEYTLFVAKRLSEGRVFAFEPLPAMGELLARNVAHNNFKNVTLMRYGLSDLEGTLPIYEVRDKHEGLATLYAGNREINATYSVELKVLDNEMEKIRLQRLDFIKIDIEGGELFALKGGRGIIQKFKPVVMVEVNEITYGAAGYTTGDIFELFKGLHYKPFVLNKQGALEPCEQVPRFSNVIFVPQ